MAQSTFNIRMDEALKKQFDELYNDFGINAEIDKSRNEMDIKLSD